MKIGATQFQRETGLSRRCFYNWLNEMKKNGIVSESENKLDMDNQWVINKLDSSGTTGQRGFKAPPTTVKSSDGKTSRVDFSNKITSKKNPTGSDLLMIEQVEKVRKLQIDNAIKAKNVVAKKVVETMISKIDEATNRIILDGRLSFVPMLYDQCKNNKSLEEVQWFWNDEIKKYLEPIKPFLIKILEKNTDD